MNRITTPIMGSRCTEVERNAILDDCREAAQQLGESVAKTLSLRLNSTMEKLTDSELLDLTRGGVQAFRLCKALMIADGLQHLESQYNAEALRLDVKRAGRWLKNR